MVQDDSRFSRRQFLTASTLAIASTTLLGESRELLATEENDRDVARETREVSADLVVIGGGGSGLASALAAAQQGVKKVLVLEAGNVLGGNSIYPEGIFGGQSKVLERLNTGMRMEEDEAFQTMMDAGRWRLNAPLVRALIDGSGETIDWLAGLGVDFGLMPSMPGRGGGPAEGGPPAEGAAPGGPPEAEAPASEGGEGSGSVRIGGVIVQALIKRCRELGIEILTQTRGKQLLKDRNGRITGVLAEQKDGSLKVSAKGVIIATGGFSGNVEMMSRFLPPFEEGDNVFVGGIAQKGEGIQMAEEAGAGLEPRGATEFAMDRFMVPGGPGPESIYLIFLTMKQSVLPINKNGLRIPDNTNNIWRQPGKLAYLLFDEKMKQEFYKTEVRESDRKLFGTSPWWRGGDSPDKIGELTDVWVNVEKDLQKFALKGGVNISNSWDEMAKWMEVSPDVLKTTIDEYNAGCDSGKDLFVRNKRALSPLRTPPYYAITCGLTLLVTHGVVKTNKKMQVVDTNEDPIPGLYVVGDDIGGVDEDIYGGMGGHSIGFAMTSGRIAGKNAAIFIAKKP